MRLNFDLLRASKEKRLATVATPATASNGAGLAVATTSKISGDSLATRKTQDDQSPLSPLCRHFEKPLKASNDEESPLSPLSPLQKTKFAPELLSNPAATTTPKTIFIALTYEIDGGRGICLDRTSQSLGEAVTALRQRFPGRVGKIWQQNIEVGIK